MKEQIKIIQHTAFQFVYRDDYQMHIIIRFFKTSNLTGGSWNMWVMKNKK